MHNFYIKCELHTRLHQKNDAPVFSPARIVKRFIAETLCRQYFQRYTILYRTEYCQRFVYLVHALEKVCVMKDINRSTIFLTWQCG